MTAVTLNGICWIITRRSPPLLNEYGFDWRLGGGMQRSLPEYHPEQKGTIVHV